MLFFSDVLNMRKENLVPAKVSELTAPLTRARAAALRASGQVPPLKAPIQQNQKRTFQGNQKTPDLDENNNNAPNDACLQHKRRAVLKDVTNICCKSSYRNCFNATTIQVNIQLLLICCHFRANFPMNKYKIMIIC